MALLDGEEVLLVRNGLKLGRIVLRCHHAGAVRLRFDFPRDTVLTRRELL